MRPTFPVTFRWLTLSIIVPVLSFFLSGDQLSAETPAEFFEARIRPVLVDRCYGCHGPDEAKSGLRLDSRDSLLTGGEQGPVIVPGNPEESLLIKVISGKDAELIMPPEDSGERLTEQQVADFTFWIREGAFDPRTGRPAVARDFATARRHWAFQPVQRPEIPSKVHPVDYLINQKLAASGFIAAPAANSATLARRAAFDLLGLPPTASQQQQAAVNFPGLIDSLLESTHYGERWGRHWMDVARYADTKDGVLMYGDARIRPFAYTYRDYVIRSFNEDKPFDRFIQEQLAADLLNLPADAPELAAMGFLTLGRMFDNNQHDVIDDQIDVMSRGILGLTVSCSRCHDHKFDPVPITDYYSLYGVFAGSVQPFEKPRIETPSADGQKFETDLAEKLAALQKMRSEQHQLLVQAATDRVEDYLVKVATTQPDVSETSVFFLSLLPEDLRPPIVNRWRRLVARRMKPDDPVFGPWHDLIQNGSAVEKDLSTLAAEWKQRGVDGRVTGAVLAGLQNGSTGTAGAAPNTSAAAAFTPETVARIYGRLLYQASQTSIYIPGDPLSELIAGPASPCWFNESQTWYYLSRHEKDKYGGMVNELDTLATASPHAAARAMVMRDSDEPSQPVVFRRGDPTQPGDPVPRQFLQVLSPNERRPFGPGSGRLDLARSITSPENPLTARVWVNRVWMHHFGEPLVENPSDFGLRTERPLHHELLDFLATELVRNNWQLKPVHRLILTSAAWQRSSVFHGDDLLMTNTTNSATAAVTADQRRQLTKQQAEDPGNRLLWRGNRRRLDTESMRDSLLAISGQLDPQMYGRPVSLDEPSNRRRTVYAMVERQSIPGIVRSFDVASADSSVARRTMTTVPQQALFAMNSAFMTQIAESLAGRLTKGEPASRIDQLYQFVFVRSPTADEQQAGLEFVSSATWEEYAQVLLMTNELMFVD